MNDKKEYLPRLLNPVGFLLVGVGLLVMGALLICAVPFSPLLKIEIKEENKNAAK